MELPISINNMLYLVISLVGIFIIASALRRKRQADASQGWPGVQGQVLDSRVEKRETTDSDGSPTTDYTPYVHYKYPVMGQEFTSERVSFGTTFSGPKIAREIVERYPAGKLVTVYYNPDHPEQSVLERTSGANWLQIAIGIVLVAAGIYYAVK